MACPAFFFPDGSPHGQGQGHRQRHRRHPSNTNKNWSPSLELAKYRPDDKTTTVAPEAWVFLSVNASEVLAHIGTTAILPCLVKEDIKFGMVSTKASTNRLRPLQVCVKVRGKLEFNYGDKGLSEMRTISQIALSNGAKFQNFSSFPSNIHC